MDVTLDVFVSCADLGDKDDKCDQLMSNGPATESIQDKCNADFQDVTKCVSSNLNLNKPNIVGFSGTWLPHPVPSGGEDEDKLSSQDDIKTSSDPTDGDRCQVPVNGLTLPKLVPKKNPYFHPILISQFQEEYPLASTIWCNSNEVSPSIAESFMVAEACQFYSSNEEPIGDSRSLWDSFGLGQM